MCGSECGTQRVAHCMRARAHSFTRSFGCESFRKLFYYYLFALQIGISFETLIIFVTTRFIFEQTIPSK